jgi:uncharacterized pyridoxal phosphate-containing UPF0001 family protein
LDGDARLRSGHKVCHRLGVHRFLLRWRRMSGAKRIQGSHVVGRFELDTMCRQFEREDILQVYMQDGKSPSSLSENEAEELLAQVSRSNDHAGPWNVLIGHLQAFKIWKIIKLLILSFFLSCA